jgi:DTW domain-containing protein YfiP
MRDFCLKCRKAAVTCYCGRLRPFASSPDFVILIHPREERNSVGTGRMLHLSLTNSLLISGHDFTRDDRVNALIADPERHCALLYPGPQALDLSFCEPDEARAFTPPGKRLTLFIIDGTWNLARGMVHRSANLKALPQVRFTPDRPSAYRIRQQPLGFCFSTLEAAHWIIERFAALGLSERPAGNAHDALLETFASMVRQQLRYAEDNPGGRADRGVRLPASVCYN